MSNSPTHDWDSLGIAIERLPDETPDAYSAFLQYAWLMPSQRSCQRVADDTGHAVLSCKRWHKDYNWQDRAATVDGIKWIHEFKAREASVAKDNEKFVEENRRIKEQGLEMSKKMLNVAGKLLDSAELADEIIETDHIMVGDRKVALNTTIKMKSKVSDIPRLVDTAIKVTRLVQDLPTEIVEFSEQIPVGSDLKGLSVEQLMALREKNQAILREKGAIAGIQTAPDNEN